MSGVVLTVWVLGLDGAFGLQRFRVALVVDGHHAELVVLTRGQVADVELRVLLIARTAAGTHPATWEKENVPATANRGHEFAHFFLLEVIARTTQIA